MIEMHLRGTAAPGRRADLYEFLREAIPFYESPGGIRVRVLWDLKDPDRFVEVVEYADRETYDRDQIRAENDPQMLAYLKRWSALLAGPPQPHHFEVDTPAPLAPPSLAGGE